MPQAPPCIFHPTLHHEKKGGRDSAWDKKNGYFISPSAGITLAAALPLSNDGVDPVTELADTSVDGRRVDVAVGGSPGDNANQGPAIPSLVYQRSTRVTLRRKFLFSSPGTCSKLVPATPAT